MSILQERLFGAYTEAEIVPSMGLDDIVQRAVDLLREQSPCNGYYLAFSGGKDSCVCKKLLELSGVSFDAWYNQTTIDPPELIRFIREHHGDVKWNRPKHGNMMHRVATAPKVPPTRSGRWCCQEYKEASSPRYRVKVFGVRVAESASRKKHWSEITVDMYDDRAICPIVYWTESQVWEFIHAYKVPYCSLYDEGWHRLGCIGCPLADKKQQKKEFERWPRFADNWKRAVIANWERWHSVPNSFTGKPRYHAKFASGEAFWQWWLTAKAPDVISGTCQPALLYINKE